MSGSAVFVFVFVFAFWLFAFVTLVLRPPLLASGLILHCNTTHRRNWRPQVIAESAALFALTYGNPLSSPVRMPNLERQWRLQNKKLFRLRSEPLKSVSNASKRQ